jgi:shikimate 5-dehydrogenase
MTSFYNPLETRLLREAREVSCTTIDGLGMLIYTNVYAAQVVPMSRFRRPPCAKKRCARWRRDISGE